MSMCIPRKEYIHMHMRTHISLVQKLGHSVHMQLLFKLGNIAKIFFHNGTDLIFNDCRLFHCMAMFSFKTNLIKS